MHGTLPTQIKAISPDTLVRLVALRACSERHRWVDIEAFLNCGLSWQALRGHWRRYSAEVDIVACPLCSSHQAEQETHDYLLAHGQKDYFSQDGNYARFQATAIGAKAIEDVLLDLGVDLDEWHVTKWYFKRWEMGAKLTEGELTWTQGVMDGHLSYQGIGKEELWSLGGELARTKPVAFFPAIQPINLSATVPQPRVRTIQDGAIKILVICDLHMGFRKAIKDAKLVPFHDRAVLDLALQIATEDQPDVILFLGDTADLADWSDRFLKEPSFYFTTQPVILEFPWWLMQFRLACPNARIYVTQGNHEARIPRAILTHLSAAYGLRAVDELDLPPQMTMPRLWALHQLHVEWSDGYPDDEIWLAPWLRAKHGHKISQQPGATAKLMLKAGVSTIFAHAHRMESASDIVRVHKTRRTIHSFCPGCACHTDGRVPGHSLDQNWQAGLGEVTICDDPPLWTATQGEIIHGQIVWGHKRYTARDRLQELRVQYPEWNW